MRYVQIVNQDGFVLVDAYQIKNINMKKELIFFIIAFLLLSFVCTDIFWWIQISSDYSKSLQQVNIEYLKKFPELITNGKQVAILNILLLSISILLFLKSEKFRKIKGLSFALIIINAIIVLWQTFTLL